MDSVLEFRDLNFGGTADLDDGDTTGESSESFLELVLVVFGGGTFDLLSDLVGSLVDVLFGAGSTHDDDVVLGDDDLLG